MHLQLQKSHSLSYKRDSEVQWRRWVLYVCISPLVLNDVFGGIIIFPFEQFELFKTKHASCDVTKVGAGGISVSTGESGNEL